jgi:hypothetical protein
VTHPTAVAPRACEAKGCLGKTCRRTRAPNGPSCVARSTASIGDFS